MRKKSKMDKMHLMIILFSFALSICIQFITEATEVESMIIFFIAYLGLFNVYATQRVIDYVNYRNELQR